MLIFANILNYIFFNNIYSNCNQEKSENYYKKYIDCQMELIKTKDALKKLDEKNKAKASQITQLSQQASYYKSKSNTLQSLLADLKQKNLISSNARDVLNVKKRKHH